jgi:uncharacterized protein (UPF0332 family)
VINGQDFLRLADALLAGPSEVEWRSAVSRAYYAAFHVARDLLFACGFAAPRGDQAHAFLWLRLSNASAAAVENAGRNLQTLRRDRNRADYDLTHPLAQATAATQVQAAKDIVNALQAAAQEPVRTQIVDAIKIYERDVLKDVTWHP